MQTTSTILFTFKYLTSSSVTFLLNNSIYFPVCMALMISLLKLVVGGRVSGTFCLFMQIYRHYSHRFINFKGQLH